MTLYLQKYTGTILLIDIGNHRNESGQISEFPDVSAQVELAGQKSNYLDQDLLNLINLKSILIAQAKHPNRIGSV